MDAFEKLEVWQRSCRLAVAVYKMLNGCRDYGFRDQASRSGLSVPSNIAEGYERNSRNEYVRFLKIAKGSCGELRTQLYIGSKAGLIDGEVASELINESIEVARMLQGLIISLESVDR